MSETQSQSQEPKTIADIMEDIQRLSLELDEAISQCRAPQFGFGLSVRLVKGAKCTTAKTTTIPRWSAPASK